LLRPSKQDIQDDSREKWTDEVKARAKES